MPIELQPEHQGTPLDTQGRDYPDFVKERAPKQWTEEEKKLYLDVAFSFLGILGEQEDSGFHTGLEDDFAIKLRDAGLLAQLEEAGVLPVITNPNPYSLRHEHEQWRAWWNNHPDEQRTMETEQQHRARVLTYLYAGTVVGHVYGEVMVSLEKQTWPGDYTRDLEDDFEVDLKHIEILHRLERSGVWPKNPMKRAVALKGLYAGAVLGHIAGEELLSLMKEASSWGPWMYKEDATVDPLQKVEVPEDKNSLPQHRSMIVGKEGFNWREELSEDGQRLYKLLVREMGDIDSLPAYAAEDGFDLNVAMEELKGHGLLDESIPGLVRLIRREVK